MELDFKDSAGERKEKTQVFMVQRQKRRGLIPWLVILVLLIAVAALLKTSFAAHARQKEMEEDLARQHELLEKMNTRLREAEEASERNSVPVITSETIKDQLGSLQQLVTQEYIYTNADKSESYAQWGNGWKLPFSGKSILITYDGTIKAGIDLSKTQIDVNEDSRTITVILPVSTVTDNNIPQESIEVVGVKNGLFNGVTLEDYNAFISDQKTAMEKKAIASGLLTKANQQAEATLRTFLSLIPGVAGQYKIVFK